MGVPVPPLPVRPSPGLRRRKSGALARDLSPLLLCLSVPLLLIMRLAMRPPADPGPPIELRYGAPTADYVSGPGFSWSYDGRVRTSRWALEYLDARRVAVHGRAGSFRADQSIPAEVRAENSDYLGTEYDRGHLVPAADMAWSRAAEHSSFSLTNAAPQNAALNRGLWAHLERELRADALHRQIWIATGPAWLPGDAPPQGAEQSGADDHVHVPLIGGDHLWVPTHWWKVSLTVDPAPELRAWMVPNATPPEDAVLGDYRVSVDEIEHWAGVDLWPLLEHAAELERER